MVTVLVLTGAALRKQIHERATMGGDEAAARRLARSASELVVHQSRSGEAAFREMSATGVIFSDLAVQPGTISATVLDAQTKGVPSQATTQYRVVADARAGRARSRLGFTLETPDDPLGAAIAEHPAAVAYWPMDEVNQPQATEQIAGHHGVYGSQSVSGLETHIHGNPVPRMGWHNEFVRVPHGSAFQTGDGTLVFWVRVNLEPQGNIRLTLVSKERVPLDSSLSLILYADDDDLVYTLSNAGQSRSIRLDNDILRFGEWQFIAITWGARGMEIYIDGQLAGRQSSFMLGLAQVGTQPFPWYRAPNTQDWYFGVRNVPEYGFQQSEPLLGSMARVSLFNQQLDESAIAKLGTLSSVEPGFVLVPESFARVTD
jgi:hypothetical protein